MISLDENFWNLGNTAFEGSSELHTGLFRLADESLKDEMEDSFVI